MSAPTPAPLRDRIAATLWPAPGPDGHVRPPVAQVHSLTVAMRVAEIVLEAAGDAAREALLVVQEADQADAVRYLEALDHIAAAGRWAEETGLPVSRFLSPEAAVRIAAEALRRPASRTAPLTKET